VAGPPGAPLGALMVWMPWQSVQTGASVLRARWPGRGCSGCIPTARRPWQRPQVAGTLNLLISDLASLAGRMSCAPWQSVQTAACCEPFRDRAAVDALLVVDKLLQLLPVDSIRNFCPWQAPQVAEY